MLNPSEDTQRMAWCRAFWIAMITAIVLLWYAVVTTLIEEHAAMRGGAGEPVRPHLLTDIVL